MGTDDQQESLSWFLAGFIEGEGALVAGIKRHPTVRSRLYVQPSFFLYQHANGRRVLELAQRVFGSGRIYPKPGNPKVLVYTIMDRRSLAEKVVPFFERYVMPFSCKRETFERFREILEMKNRREHRTPAGMIRMVEEAYAMNPQGKGRRRIRTIDEVRERILRDCTPDPRKEVKIQSVPSGD
jgi:hypothetical protein